MRQRAVPVPRRVPRRGRLIAGLLALALGLATAACGGSGASASDGGWSFTDDTGATVRLGQRPTRVAGLNDVLSSLWNYGIQPVASFGQTSIADDVAFEGRDTSKVSIVGTSYGQIDLEKLAAARPDVIVTSVYPVDATGKLDPGKPYYGFESLEQQEQVGKIAPVIAIAWRGSAAGVIERTAQLAEALGVDLDSPEMTAMRQQYEQASARLKKAAARGLTVLPVYATPSEGWWMAKAADDPSLHLYQELGVTFVDPGGDGYFWQSVGWEEVPRYPSDVILYSLRFSMTPQEIAAQPTAALLPAVKAGQLYPWKYLGMDYVAQAGYMDELAGWLESARKVA